MRKIIAIVLISLFCVTSLAYADIQARAEKVYNIPGNFQTRVEYTGNNPIYIGICDRGLASSIAQWFIVKITWTGDNPTLFQTANNVAWDNRATSTYQ